MAQALGVSRQTMTAIEKGKYNPSLELSLKIAAYFDRPFDEIFIWMKGRINEWAFSVYRVRIII